MSDFIPFAGIIAYPNNKTGLNRLVLPSFTLHCYLHRFNELTSILNA
nr:MAG TPA: hypothetical protein [Caudoviricetes sp.]